MQVETRFKYPEQNKDSVAVAGKKGRRVHPLAFLTLLILSVFLLAFDVSMAAQAPASDDPSPVQSPAAKMTLAIFPDPAAKPISEGLWQDLVAALRTELTSDSPEMRVLTAAATEDTSISDTQPDLPLQILRGDKIVPGLSVDNPITIYLVGECIAAPKPQIGLFHPAVYSGVLGWVQRSNGEIEPFIHVDCKHIGQILGQRALGLSSSQRERLMANAIARVVILHEWIHIATQNPHHAKHGVAKAEFSV
jgi:hypothetical protein